jgi:outer membrane lipoprotein-sorting protein
MSKAERLNRFCALLLAATLLFAWALLPPRPCAAKAGPLRAVSAAEKQKLFERFSLLRRDIRAIHASVVQEKRSPSLKKKVVVKGSVTLARPNMLRWDVVKPERSITAIDGETMVVYHPAVREAQVYVMSENIIARNTMTFFSSVMSGDMGEMEARFRVEVFSNGSEVEIRLAPKSRMIALYLSGVVIHMDEKTALPTGFEVTTPRGDRTVTRLSNIKVNPEIRPGLFQLKLPSDVMITNRVEPVKD